MKFIRHLNRSIQLSGLALAAAAFLCLPLAGQAQDQEKGASKLMRSRPVTTAAHADPSGDAKAMSCPLCKNSPGMVVEKSLKANVPDTKTFVSAHQCADCTTRIVVRGGKTEAKTVHACNANASDKGSCCAGK